MCICCRNTSMCRRAMKSKAADSQLASSHALRLRHWLHLTTATALAVCRCLHSSCLHHYLLLVCTSCSVSHSSCGQSKANASACCGSSTTCAPAVHQRLCYWTRNLPQATNSIPQCIPGKSAFLSLPRPHLQRAVGPLRGQEPGAVQHPVLAGIRGVRVSNNSDETMLSHKL